MSAAGQPGPDPKPERPGQPLDSARDALATFWGLVEKRLELAATEFQEQRHRLVDQLVRAAVVGVLALMTLITGTFLVIILTWNTAAREWVMVALTLAYAGGATWGFFALKRKLAETPPPFSATIGEFRKDRAWFQKKS